MDTPPLNLDAYVLQHYGFLTRGIRRALREGKRISIQHDQVPCHIGDSVGFLVVVSICAARHASVVWCLHTPTANDFTFARHLGDVMHDACRNNKVHQHYFCRARLSETASYWVVQYPPLFCRANGSSSVAMIRKVDGSTTEIVDPGVKVVCNPTYNHEDVLQVFAFPKYQLSSSITHEAGVAQAFAFRKRGPRIKRIMRNLNELSEVFDDEMDDGFHASVIQSLCISINESERLFSSLPIPLCSDWDGIQLPLSRMYNLPRALRSTCGYENHVENQGLEHGQVKASSRNWLLVVSQYAYVALVDRKSSEVVASGTYPQVHSHEDGQIELVAVNGATEFVDVGWLECVSAFVACAPLPLDLMHIVGQYMDSGLGMDLALSTRSSCNLLLDLADHQAFPPLSH